MAAADWKNLFDNFGIKKVTKTDKSKRAYVPNAQQLAAIQAAGVTPSTHRPAPGRPVTVLFDAGTKSVECSYYQSQRSEDADRNPEPRMGHSFISAWLEEGDTVIIGNVGNQLFVAKEPSFSITEQSAADELVRKADPATILKIAKAARGKPPTKLVQRQDFVRNPYVVAGALIRARQKCEMPGCSSALFARDDGSIYLEVHHVHPLAEGGNDSLENAAAVCPSCHRELHLGKERSKRRTLLKNYIATLNP